MNDDEAAQLRPGDEIKLTAISKTLTAVVIEVQLVEERHVVVFELGGTRGFCTSGFVASLVKRAAVKPPWYDKVMG